MRIIKKFWQLIFMIILAAVLMPFINFTHPSYLEYRVLIILAINIIVETIDVFGGLGDDHN